MWWNNAGQIGGWKSKKKKKNNRSVSAEDVKSFCLYNWEEEKNCLWYKYSVMQTMTKRVCVYYIHTYIYIYIYIYISLVCVPVDQKRSPIKPNDRHSMLLLNYWMQHHALDCTTTWWSHRSRTTLTNDGSYWFLYWWYYIYIYIYTCMIEYIADTKKEYRSH